MWSALRDAATHLGAKGKSVDARAVLCDALAADLHPDATGSAAASDAALAALLAPVAAADGNGNGDRDGEAVRLGAYGGRRLVAALKGVGDDAGKSKVLAPALRWALGGGVGAGGGGGASSFDVAALAVELLDAYTVSYAEGTDWGGGSKEGRKKGGAAAAAADEMEMDAPESWRVYLAALSSPAPAPARVAAMSRATPEFVAALPAATRASLLRRLFTAVGSDADAGARAAARDAVDALRLRADDVSTLLRAASSAASTAAAAATAADADADAPGGGGRAAKRAKGGKTAAADTDVGGSGALAASATAAAIAALEVVGWKAAADVESRGDLKAPCQELLASLLDAAAAFRGRDEDGGDDEDDEEEDSADDDDAPRPAKKQPSFASAVATAGEASSGYAQALVLTTLEMLARDDDASAAAATPSKSKGKKAAPAAPAAAAWDVTLIVRAVQEAEAGPAREAALALLAAVAASDAKGVMDHVLEVSAALAHRASNASDDPLAQRALESALSAVVPAWIAGGFGVGAAAAKVRVV